MRSLFERKTRCVFWVTNPQASSLQSSVEEFLEALCHAECALLKRRRKKLTLR
jgi:hypothetical protein